MSRPRRPPVLAPDVPAGGRGNEHADLVPVHGRGAGAIEFDFARVAIGTAEYLAGPTGCTVVAIDGGGRTAVDQRGGAVGLSGGFPFSHAICLSGGSTYGLAAASGVADEWLRRSGYATGFDQLPAISGAVVYDFGPRDNAVYPDAALGRAALRAATTGSVAVGRVGGGVCTTVGKLHPDRAEYAGQGAAFTQVGPVKVLVVAVVNAIGVVVDRDGAIVRGNYDTSAEVRRHPAHDYAAALTTGQLPTGSGLQGNTTITAVVTNVVLDDGELAQFARQVHGSMHRAIQPFHTALDGDVLFAVTTDEVDLASIGDASNRRGISPTAVAAVASETAWDAVLRSVDAGGDVARR